MSETDLMSDAFQLFFRETPQYSKAWMEAVQKLDAANALLIQGIVTKWD